MKLLIVAMPESVHTARWILQLLDQGWTIYLFPSNFYLEPHPLLRERIDRRYAWARYFGARLRPGKIHLCGVFDFGLRLPKTRRRLGNLLIHFIVQFVPHFHQRHLNSVIRRFRPDLVHSLEFQLAGAICLDAKRTLKKFPRWIATNWGSDIFLFGKLPWSKPKVLEILKECDVYSCECERDVTLARELGFKGQVWPVLPNTGGFDFEVIERIRNAHRLRPRNIIALKGYNGWSGRAVFIVEAFKRNASLLKDYKIVCFSWNEDTRIALELARQQVGLDYELIPHESNHSDILHILAQSVLYIGGGISDGISTSCLEAMAMGAFPLQAASACCSEWFQEGVSGLKFNPENIDQTAEVLQRVLRDREFRDRARDINDMIVRDRLERNTLRKAVIDCYRASLDAAH